MLPPLFRLEPILEACEQQHVVLTANQRLRSKALQAWAVRQQSLGIDIYTPPLIFTLEQWFQQHWHQLQDCADPISNVTILSSEQENVIWERITADCGLMQPDKLAQQAADGWHTLQQWQLPLSVLTDSEHIMESPVGIDVYRQWCHEFEQQLEKQHAITWEMAWQRIANALERGVLKQQPAIYLVGFDSLSPLITHLLNRFTDNIKHVYFDDFSPQCLERIHCQDTDAEMLAAADWARHILEQQPHSRVGIIVPELGQCRTAIERALTNTFECQSLFNGTPRYTLPFNISAGTPLATTPLIRCALLLLRLQQPFWPADQLCQLLFSPFWGKLSEEREDRCNLVDRIQRLGVFDMELSTLRYYAEKLGNPSLFQYFSGLYQYQRGCQGKRLPSDWVEHFLAQLSLMGWPGERQPDSHEYQQTQLFYQLLERFAALDSTLGHIDHNTALSQLQSMASHTPFQAQVPDSPIQVLGILEGAGLHFTHCWIMGLHQQAWPPAPKPNPLLPLTLQREQRMPHASHERELAFAESLTRQYRHCADHIIFSTPTYDKDTEQDLQASPLIADIPLASNDYSSVISPLEDHQQKSYLSRQFEYQPCSQGPAVSANKTELAGGASVIKAQAANPFDAFAQFRLHTRTLSPAVPGFSPQEQGTLLHQTLAALWQHWKTQQQLRLLPVEERRQQVNRVLTQEIERFRRQKSWHLTHRLCDIEIERQTRLILQWLDYECEREPFTVVATEHPLTVKLAGVSLQLRIDRIDQLDDGSFLIIDYKTGVTTLNDWSGERPADPQLPLYLLAHHEPVAGIAFAEINVKTKTLKGLHSDDHHIAQLTSIANNRQQLPTNWKEAHQHWQSLLNRLLTDFLSGDCRVDYGDKKPSPYQQELLALNRFYDKKRLALLEVRRETRGAKGF